MRLKKNEDCVESLGGYERKVMCKICPLTLSIVCSCRVDMAGRPFISREHNLNAEEFTENSILHSGGDLTYRDFGFIPQVSETGRHCRALFCSIVCRGIHTRKFVYHAWAGRRCRAYGNVNGVVCAQSGSEIRWRNEHISSAYLSNACRRKRLYTSVQECLLC